MGATVMSSWNGGGNLQDGLTNDDIVAWWFSLVPSEVQLSGELSFVCVRILLLGLGFGGAVGSCRNRSIKV